MTGMSIIVKTITRLVIGFLVLFGFYLFLHGHITHGVGFAGGVIVALAFILYLIAFGKDAALKKVNETKASLAMNLAFLVLLVIAITGILYGHLYTPAVRPGGLFASLTILLANAALCLTTAGSLFFIFVNLVSFRSDKD